MEDENSYSTNEVRVLDDPVENLLDFDQDFSQNSKHLEEDDEILDLAGGAQDAIARHRATGNHPENHKNQENQREHPEKIEKVAETVQTKSKTSVLVELVYWRDLQKTGVCFGASLFLLLSLSACSIVSVVSYISLVLLSVTISFRIYKGIVQAVQKSEDGHPFKMYLEQDVAISSDVVHKYSDMALVRFNAAVKELRRLFLVEDLVDSLKFAVLMWILTYVGSLFNGLTLIIFAHVAVFTWPVIYEKHQVQIDHYYDLVNTQVKDVVKKIQAKIPGAKPKTE